MRAVDFIDAALKANGRLVTAVKKKTFDEPLAGQHIDTFQGAPIPFLLRFVRRATKQDWKRQISLYERLVKPATLQQKRADERTWEIWEVEVLADRSRMLDSARLP